LLFFGLTDQAAERLMKTAPNGKHKTTPFFAHIPTRQDRLRVINAAFSTDLQLLQNHQSGIRNLKSEI